jgi:hypothetical protein
MRGCNWLCSRRRKMKPTLFERNEDELSGLDDLLVELVVIMLVDAKLVILEEDEVFACRNCLPSSMCYCLSMMNLMAFEGSSIELSLYEWIGEH